MNELRTSLIKLDDGKARLIVWEIGKTIDTVKDIFESDIRSVLNHQLTLAREHGFTDKKFRVRE